MINKNKVRLVVGLFDTAEELRRGIVELYDQHLRRDQVNLIAQANALHGALAAWSDGSEELGLGVWIICRRVDGPERWALAPEEDSEDAPREAYEVAHSLLELNDWALARQTQQLDRCLQADGALLLVEPDTDIEERAACTVLLRHASGGVQTHEITRLG